MVELTNGTGEHIIVESLRCEKKQEGKMSTLLKVGIQLIVFGKRVREDLDSVLRDCRAAGFVCVEKELMMDTYTASQLRGLCTKHDLEYAAGHGGYENVCDDKAVQQTIRYVKESGGSYIICSGVAPGEGISSYKEAARAFNHAGRMIKDAGLTFCYHNHADEFKEIGGVKGIEVLGEKTDSELVKFNMDIAWVQIAGEDPVQFIETYKDRVGYYHFKDAFTRKEKPEWTELGKGDVELKPAYETAVKFNAEYIIYEQDKCLKEVRTAITESRNFLRELGA